MHTSIASTSAPLLTSEDEPRAPAASGVLRVTAVPPCGDAKDTRRRRKAEIFTRSPTPDVANRISTRSATPRMVAEASDRRRCSDFPFRATARSATPRLAGAAACEIIAGGRAGSRRCSSARSACGPKARSFTPQGDENERCSCCSKETCWAAYDVFYAMDIRGVDAVQRVDWVWALGALGTGVEFSRTMRKANLSAYFHATAKDLYLEEFIQRMFPCLTPADSLSMWRWVNFRKAWHILRYPDFRASAEDLQKIFGHLTVVGEAQVPVSALVRSHILTDTELRGVLFENRQDCSSVNFEEFLALFQTVFTEKYAKPDLDALGGVSFFAGCRDRFEQGRMQKAPASMPKSPAKSAWADMEEPFKDRNFESFKEASPQSQAPARGPPRIPCRPSRRAWATAGRTAIAGCRLQSAFATPCSARAGYPV